ncbi:uncharacterized protein LOC117786662 [Drosophila innubila]|uniref:uncharacterized protein LOC117786662 n=1 Tax=Drosophila innubila TaxID=198719 RepID=UPI00148B9AD1|nr:uncharacterized protein LOC117786662 [Drosophila innubila]
MESRAALCSIRIRSTELKDPQPLLIRPGTSEIYPYTAYGYVQVASGEPIEFFCSKSLDWPFSGKKSVTAFCMEGSWYKIGDNEYHISEFRCLSWPDFIGKSTGSRCSSGNLIDVGFELNGKRFIKEYEVCFDENEEVTRYVYHTLDRASNYYATGVDQIKFAHGGFFASKKVDKLYTPEVQKETINKALGMDASRYINSDANRFLTRGLLAAETDFAYTPEQRSAFMFINAAPQWQSFNVGNWARVVEGVKEWATKTGKKLDCWTGVWGVTTLPNKVAKQTPLYLSYDEQGNGLIPVPKIFFRVIIEPATQKGIVLVGVNNPYLSTGEIENGYILCKDVSDRINWINWKRNIISAGYSYACEVMEFRRKVINLPQFKVSGLLV